MEYKGHKARIRAVSVLKTGQLIASCDEKGLCLVFEVLTSRVVWSHQFETPIVDESKKAVQSGICYSVKFSNDAGLLAISFEEEIFMVNLKCLPKEMRDTNARIISESKIVWDKSLG